MNKKYNSMKKTVISLIIACFLTVNLCYARESSYLRVPLGISSSRAKSAQMAISSKTQQFGIRLKGGILINQENETFIKDFEQLATKAIKTGKAWTLLEDRKAQLKGDKNINKLSENSAFYQALRAHAKDFPPGFDIVILETEKGLPIDLMLHAGHSRNQAYIAYSTLKTLEDIYNNLKEDYRPDHIKIIIEGFNHEAKHILLRGTLKNKSPPEIERAIDENAPSFRAREIFRIVYLMQRLSDPELGPDMNMFFENLKGAKNKASHLFAYTGLSLERHLDIAERLLARKDYGQIDVILAQHHIGYALANAINKPEDVNSPIVKRAIGLLKDKNIIDKGPETDSPYPVWKFARELIIQNKIAFLKDIAGSNIILSHMDQLNPWINSTQASIGDTVRYPKPGETMALPVSMEKAAKIIRSMRLLKDKEGIIAKLKGLKDNEGKEYVLISHEDLKIIGEALVDKAVTSTSAAGAGTRFALVIGFDQDGKPLFHDMAKGVLKLSLIDGGRSFIEMFLAQAAYINDHYSLSENKIPCIIYTSHVTDKDVKAEMERIGYSQLNDRSSRYARYRHSGDSRYSDVTVVRLHKTNLLDLHNGDFFVNIDSEVDWMQTHWPHAHDSALIDLITSGLAYEAVKDGKVYVDISNVDNRAAGTDPVLLATMELTGTALINETVLKPKGERGGGAPVSLKEPLFKGHRRGNLERGNMEPSFEKSLTKDQTLQYLPNKNTANYCVNIMEYIKQAFMNPEATESDVLAFLKEFYDARDDEEKKAELTFKKLEAPYRINDKFMFVETSKKFPAVQTGSLLGSHTWLVDTLFVETSQGEGAGIYTRFEENKENIENLRRIEDFLRKLLVEKAEEDGIAGLSQEEILNLINIYGANKAHNITSIVKSICDMTVAQMFEYLEAKSDSNGKSEMKYAVKSIGIKEGARVIDLLKATEGIYQIQHESLMRTKNKNNRYYPGEALASNASLTYKDYLLKGREVDSTTKTLLLTGNDAKEFLLNTNQFYHETTVCNLEPSRMTVEIEGTSVSLDDIGIVAIKPQSKVLFKEITGNIVVIITQNPEAVNNWYRPYNPDNFPNLFADKRYNESGIISPFEWRLKGVTVMDYKTRVNQWTLQHEPEWLIDSMAFGANLIGISMVKNDIDTGLNWINFNQIRPQETFHHHPNKPNGNFIEVYYIVKGMAALASEEGGAPRINILKAGDMLIAKDGIPHTIVAAKGPYKHLAIQIPSTFQYGFEFKQNLTTPQVIHEISHSTYLNEILNQEKEAACSI